MPVSPDHPLYSITDCLSPGRNCQGHCDGGIVCEAHPDQPMEHPGCGGAGMPCEDERCDFDAVTLAARAQIAA